VRDNLAFSLRMRDAPHRLVAERVAQAAGLLGLQAHLERYPSQLSGGQQQRVAIGRAIVRKPRLFLFDEPLSNLDGALRTQMRMEIRRLHRRLGATALYVTHDQGEAMAMADRIVVLRDGRVEQAGTPLELYDRPANLFVAGFIGLPAMNLVPAAALADPRPLVIGFRPDACRLDPPGPGGVPARVLNVEHMGAVQHVYLEAGPATVCAALPGREPWHPGQAVRFEPDPSRTLLFDAATGRALGPAR
jgi:multiple sugar transport system ATP-binding protein